jgi:hypothetical protein
LARARVRVHVHAARARDLPDEHEPCRSWRRSTSSASRVMDPGTRWIRARSACEMHTCVVGPTSCCSLRRQGRVAVLWIWPAAMTPPDRPAGRSGQAFTAQSRRSRSD